MRRHPVDRQPRRPRRGATRHLDQPTPREVPRRRAAHRARARGHAGPRRRRLPRRSPAPRATRVAWWFYEDQQYSVKRLIAAAGYPAEEIGFDGITYDQMRPGCWQPQARLDDMTMNHVEASLCFPNYPRFCGQIFLRAKDKELARLCVEAYNDWMVDEWCGDSGGRLIPLCLMPVVGRRAGVRGGAPQRGARRARGVLLRASGRGSGCRASTPATGSRCSPRARRPEP